MTHIPSKTEVETFSGQYIDLTNPHAENIFLEDIAHALSQTCRYGGHVHEFYSVAEHAVFVSHRLERKGFPLSTVLGGLHHDDHEYVFGDVVRPLKILLGDEYPRLCDRMDEEIKTALGLPELYTLDHRRIKDADDWSIFVEARHLLPSKGEGWRVGEDKLSRIVTPDYFHGGLKPRKAELLYLKRHTELVSRMA